MTWIINRINSSYHRAEQLSSPLILDLDNNGIETLGQSSWVFFDHDGNGFAQLTGWAAPTDGLLVWDRNGNGQIDDGSELFGNHTLLASGETADNGFAALAELDANGDGSVDAGDEAFSALRVWCDLNSDGALDAGELFTLDELGVASLQTGYELGDVVDEFGNAHRQIGGFTFADGATGQMADVWFAEDTARTRPTELVDVPEDISALPDVAGFGNVHDLHQAMARDESGALRALVEQFAAEAGIGRAVAAFAEADELLLAA